MIKEAGLFDDKWFEKLQQRRNQTYATIDGVTM